MPNWSFNHLLVKGGDKETRAEFVLVAGGYNHDWGDLAQDADDKDPAERLLDILDAKPNLFTKFCFKNFVPIPKEVRMNGFNGEGKIPGADSGYTWSAANFGTKWQVSDAEHWSTKVAEHYRFDTAWAPPVPVIMAAAKRFPELTFRLEYDIEGGNGRGHIVIKGGDILEGKDECI